VVAQIDGSRYGQRSRRLLYGSPYGRDDPPLTAGGLRATHREDPGLHTRRQEQFQRQYSHGDIIVGGGGGSGGGSGRGQDRNGDLSAIG
jgi:hypothetical protein